MDTGGAKVVTTGGGIGTAPDMAAVTMGSAVIAGIAAGDSNVGELPRLIDWEVGEGKSASTKLSVGESDIHGCRDQLDPALGTVEQNRQVGRLVQTPKTKVNRSTRDSSLVGLEALFLSDSKR